MKFDVYSSPKSFIRKIGTGGLMVVGGVWLLRIHLKKKKETKV